MAKRKAQSPFHGRWRIHWMSMWDEGYLDEEVEAFIEFGENGFGSFQFGYVQAATDYRITERDGEPAAEFAWEGGDAADGTPMTGRGWAVLDGAGLKGMLFIFQGDESEFTATPAKPRRRRK